jgi:hypothetical protein
VEVSAEVFEGVELAAVQTVDDLLCCSATGNGVSVAVAYPSATVINLLDEQFEWTTAAALGCELDATVGRGKGGWFGQAVQADGLRDSAREGGGATGGSRGTFT